MTGEERKPRLLRADLHLHTRHSGFRPLPLLRMRDCYATPEEVYRAAKARGMDLVALTDHDSIDGARELLDRHGDLPDLIVGEEVTVVWPEKQVSLHVNVFGITESDHREIQKARGRLQDLISLLRSRRIPYALNHLFRQAPLREAARYFEELVGDFDLFESLNGCQPSGYRALVERVARRYKTDGPPGFVGGSDAHVARRSGRACTGARASDRQGFLEELARRNVVPLGRPGEVLPLARDVTRVCGDYYAMLLAGGEPGWRRRDLWAGIVFSAATLPANLIAFPLLATAGHGAAVRLRLAALNRLLPP